MSLLLWMIDDGDGYCRCRGGFTYARGTSLTLSSTVNVHKVEMKKSGPETIYAKFSITSKRVMAFYESQIRHCYHYTSSALTASRPLRNPNEGRLIGESPVNRNRSYKNPPQRHPKKGATIGI